MWALVLAFTVGRFSARFVPSRGSNKRKYRKDADLDAKFEILIDSETDGCESDVSEVSVDFNNLECAPEVDMASVNHHPYSASLKSETWVHGVTLSDSATAEPNARVGTENASAKRMHDADKVCYRLSRPPSWHFRNPPPCINTLLDGCSNLVA